MAEIKTLITAEDKTKPAFDSAKANAESAFTGLRQAGESSLKNLEDAFQSLGIQSAMVMENQKSQIQAAYESIRSSGVASADEIIRAEQARASAIESIDQSNFATRKSLLSQFKENWFAVTGAITGAIASTRFLQSAAKEYLEAEQAANKLRIQVEGLGIAYDSVAPHIDQAVSATQQYAAVQGNEVQKALQELIYYSGDVNKSMQELTLTFDLAYQKGITTSQASELIGKALTGNVEVLSRVMPELRNLEDTLGKNATQAEKTAYTFALLQEKSAGALGKMTEHEKTVREMTLVWSEFKEYTGEGVLWVLDGLTEGFLGLRIHLMQAIQGVAWLTDVLHLSKNMYEGFGIEVANAQKQLQDYTNKAHTSGQAAASAAAAVKSEGDAHAQTAEQIEREVKARTSAAEGVRKNIDALAKYSDAIKSVGADVLKYAEAEFSLNIKLPSEGIGDMSKSIADTEKLVAASAQLAGAVDIAGVWRVNQDAIARYHQLNNTLLAETNALHQQESHALDALKTYMDGYGGVIDRVYGKQIASQKAVMSEMESMVSKQKSVAEQQSSTLTENEKKQSQELINSLNEKLRGQSLVILEAEKSQAEARLGMWNTYYNEVKALHAGAIEAEKQKSLELLSLEKQIAAQRQGFAEMVGALEEKAGYSQALSEVEKYYNTQKQLQLQYQAAMQLEGQSRIDALVKYQQAASSAVRSVTDTHGTESIAEQSAALAALDQVKAAQTEILAEQDKLKQAKQDEITLTREWASATQVAMTNAQAVTDQLTSQIITLSDRMNTLKLSIDNSRALAAIGEVISKINGIPDVTYKNIVYQIREDGAAQSTMQNALESDVIYKDVIYQIYGEGSERKPISAKIQDINTAFMSMGDIVPAVTTNFSSVTQQINRIASDITALGDIRPVIEADFSSVFSNIAKAQAMMAQLGTFGVNLSFPNLSFSDLSFQDIPQFATGIPCVENDTVAKIHKGEAVVPEQFNIYKTHTFADVKNHIEDLSGPGRFGRTENKSVTLKNNTAGNQETKTYYVSVSFGDIQIVARGTDNVQDLARRIVKPIRDELRKLENISLS